MCGIAGIINFDKKPVEEKHLKIMMQKMKHRGPDDEGVYIDKNVGLGFVRLSILDLSPAGHQPMFSNDKNLIIVFNGEVYNYIELRNELGTKYSFKTETDTEVVLAAYQEWGDKCLDKFNGMFAFVIYNNKTKEIFGARDRFGIKPFYYYVDNNKFIFASEIKSILPLIERNQNDKMIFDYLLYNRTDHTENTFFKNIKKIKPGFSIYITEKMYLINKWYKLKEKISTQKILTDEEYRNLLKESIKLRLRSDVPVGVSLSGGIDSSALVSSLVFDFGLKELNTFSAVYGKSEQSDESEYIEAFNDIIKNMHYVYPNASTFFNDFETFIDAHNEPVPDIGPYAQYKVMELASKYVTVTLDGQGADEQLAGYHYFFGIYFLELLKKFKFRQLIIENWSYYQKHRKIDPIKYAIYYLSPISLQLKINTNKFPSINKSFIENNFGDYSINKMLYKAENLNDLLYRHFMFKLEHLLKWEDLNSMHFSIESRVPFLDNRIVEATLSAPPEQKIFKGETKVILREAVKDILPSKIYGRKDKKGFSNPRDKWFRSKKFKEYIIDLLLSSKFINRGYFNSESAIKQFKKHLNGSDDFSKEIWKWINLEIWFRKFIDN